MFLSLDLQTSVRSLQFHGSLVCNAVCSPGDVQGSDGSRRGLDGLGQVRVFVDAVTSNFLLVHFLSIDVDSSTDEALRGFSCFLQAGPAQCQVKVWLCVILYNPSRIFVSAFDRVSRTHPNADACILV